MTLNTDVNALREEISAPLQQILPRLQEVAKDLHEHPEIRFEEHHAAARLTAEVREAGFELEAPYAGLDTAFIGRWSAPGSTENSPTIAVFCEYDALEGLGHACGHNIIAAAGLGAGILIKERLEATGTPGHLVLVGSPAEEGGGGKVPMIEAGVLNGVDLAMMVHPAGDDAVSATILSRVALDVRFTGRASHAAGAPHKGRNALDAATLSLSAIGLLRQQLPDDARVHAIITDGGQAPNIIPEHTAMRVFVRSEKRDELLDDVLPRVENCFHGAALATGCEVSITQPTPPYFSMITNPVLGEIAEQAMASLGRPVGEVGTLGSTDMGNVSRVVPSIHPLVSLGAGLVPHTREFAERAGSEDAGPTIADGAATLAITALAAYRDPAVVEAAAAAFEAPAQD
ncbi:M20 family metallopeptidase [Nesterenkonia flava]|uniref:Peptidase M20 domain-containing protein 2 n=1 Tax=Nesterenkonia flava TaxID=469799 RepID=A0ABU1FSL9_9MICC|nr:M20 family metallopeptidase [Nesterenkonia flava]MDR5711644.1 M20 family metallopeptidase [Nesterenkonia flava]